MRKVLAGLLSVSLAAMALAVVPIGVAAAPPSSEPALASSDELPNPLEAKRRELAQQGLTAVLSGEAKTQQINGSTVVKVGKTNGPDAAGKNAKKPKKDQYVELSRERTDRIFVILAEFGNQRHPSYPDVSVDPNTPGPIRFNGPLRNEIDQPNRAVDNSTVWQADYTPDHYRDLYFGNDESMRQYYEKQSSGRYTINGEVTDWVKVPFNEARYGRSNGFPCSGSVCSNTWLLVRDAANQWVTDQLASGRTQAQVTADMKSFDAWDRYDFDGDGNFNEPDGYIDHFQIVHAGGDQADGDPFQGEDAIWSHRWYAFQSQGVNGPPQNLLGGTQIGTTGVWIGDYTIQPENGGRSVFFHEFAHDLGLPDDYNIISGGDNNNEHWTLMAQSRLGSANDGGIGERAGDLGAWNKLQLGWLDYATVNAGQKKTLDLGPQEFNTKKKQAAVVVLPKKSVTTDNGAPYAGEKQYFSGDADDLDNAMTKQLDLGGKTSASLAFQARYGIESDFDYFYVEASHDGTTFTALDGTVGGAPFAHDGGNKPAIMGHSAGWVPVNVSLNAYAGDPSVWLRFHYVTDGGVFEGGLYGDAITVTADGSAIFTDGAETDAGWNLDGFTVVGATTTRLFDNFYIAGYRSYTSYDQYLKTGPYFFGYGSTMPDFVDHYAYQTGLLISYWDTSYGDNDTFAHPGSGRNLYIDAHPKPFARTDGVLWRSRVQVYDAPFSTKKADSMTLHVNGVAMTIEGQKGVKKFDDTKQYWYAELPNHGVKLPAVGVKIEVLKVHGSNIKIKIQ